MLLILYFDIYLLFPSCINLLHTRSQVFVTCSHIRINIFLFLKYPFGRQRDDKKDTLLTSFYHSKWFFRECKSPTTFMAVELHVYFGCGGKTRTYDLRVMSPTSCQLLHPAMFYYSILTLIRFVNCFSIFSHIYIIHL